METNLLLKRACIVFLLLCSQLGFAQLSGTVNVGAGQTYTSLTGPGGLFEAINSQGISGNVTAAIVSDLTETGTVTLNDFTSGGTNDVHLSVVPNGTTERLISGSSSLTLIKFSGVRNMKIDGSFAGDRVAHLRFRNTSTGASAQTMKFALGCTADTVTYCFIEGSNSATTITSFATVVMIDATTTGNNNLVFKHNTFRNPATATDNTTMPSFLLKSLSAGSIDNSNIVVDSNQFVNAKVTGIQLGTSGTTNADNWQITNNAFYNTLTPPSATTAKSAISIVKGHGHFISDNTIGGSNAAMGGAAWTVDNGTFYGIYQDNASSSAANRVTISNNKISNIIHSGSSTSYKLYGIFATGNYNNISGNQIGTSGQLTSNLYPAVGIYVGNTSTSARDSIVGNTVKKIISTAASTSLSGQNAVGILSVGGIHYIADNIIDSIMGNTTSNNGTTAPTGILITGASASATADYYITRNRITNIINTNTSALNNYAAAVIGLGLSGNAQPVKVFGNYIANIYGMNTSNTGGNNVMGIIDNSTTAGNDSFVNNVIIMGNGDLIADPSWVRGIHIGANNANTYSFINNTIYMSNEMTLNAPNVDDKGGAACIAALNNPNIRFYNNIFINAASNAGTGNMPVYYHMPSALTTLVGDYNLYGTTVAANLNCIDGVYYDFATWKLNQGTDQHSTNAQVTFMSNTDMHVNTTDASAWNAYGRGMAFAAVAKDADGNPRSTTIGVPVTIGAYEIAMPSVPPVAMTMAPATPVIGTPTVLSSNGRKIAEIDWDAAATLPTSMNATFYPGIAVPGSPNASNVNSYVNIQQTGFAGSYTIKLYTNDAEANGIAYNAMGAIKKHDGDANFTAIADAGSNGSDADGNYILSGNLTSFSLFGLTNPSTPLPITWNAVNATLNRQQQAVITWKVSEKDVESYTVQKSGDGLLFSDLAGVACKGDGNNAYSYTEPVALNGKAWYRIVQSGKNNEKNYSSIMMLQNSATYGRVSIYPNPATQVLNVEIARSASYAVYDLQGREAIKGSLQPGTNMVDVSGLVKGFYIIRIGEYVEQFVLQ